MRIVCITYLSPIDHVSCLQLQHQKQQQLHIKKQQILDMNSHRYVQLCPPNYYLVEAAVVRGLTQW